MFLVIKMKKKEDLRIKKTKTGLYKALLQLMEEKAFEEIKVTDICEASMINRSTFYDHFTDKYELLKDLINTMQEDLISQLEVEKETTSVKEYYLEIIKRLIDYLEKNKAIYQSISIVKKNNNSIAHDMMVDATLKAVTNNLKEKYTTIQEVPVEIVSLFYVSGVIKVCTELMKDPNHFDSIKLLKYLEKLIPDLENE